MRQGYHDKLKAGGTERVYVGGVDIPIFANFVVETIVNRREGLKTYKNYNTSHYLCYLFQHHARVKLEFDDVNMHFILIVLTYFRFYISLDLKRVP